MVIVTCGGYGRLHHSLAQCALRAYSQLDTLLLLYYYILLVEPTPTYPLSSVSFFSVPGHINTPDDDAVQASSPTSTDREEEVLPLPPPLPCVREYMSPSRSGSPAPDDNLPSSLYSPISDAPLPASLRSPTIATNKSALPLEPMSPQLPPQRCPSSGKDRGKEVGERKKKLIPNTVVPG